MSIILILTSSSINFKWLIRPESPRATSLLAPSPSSSLSGFRTIPSFAARYTRIVPILAHFRHTDSIPPRNSSRKSTESKNISDLIKVNTFMYIYGAHTFFLLLFFVCVFLIIRKAAPFGSPAQLQKANRASVSSFMVRQKEGFHLNFPVGLAG